MLLKAIQKKKTVYLLGGLVCIALFTTCSTGRNTTGTRAYHELTTRYNIYFNAEKAYHEILKEREESFQEDYSELLPFYPSLPSVEKSPSGNPFDPVIAKTEKAIRKHSITAKPHRDPSKAHSLEYRQWLKQEEFNPFMKKVWILRGKAFLQNGDYDEALSLFSGMVRLFSHDAEMVDETEIWMLRTYTEMGRIYEGEKTAYALRSKKLSSPLERLFTEHYTYFLIRKKEFTEAIPYLQKTIAQESDHLRKKRLQFLLGQIYAISGEEDKAQLAFEEVKGLRVPSQLTQNAAIWQSAITNDSLARIFRPAKSGRDTIHNTPLLMVVTDSTAGNSQHITDIAHRLSPGRTLAENAALHRQWRSRNGLWQARPSGPAERENEEDSQFSADKNGLHYLLLTFAPGSADKNKLLFITADFNFSHFKLRRFNISYFYLAGKEVLQIEPFQSFDEVSQYTELMFSDSLFCSATMKIIPIIISGKNLQLVWSGESMDKYNSFCAENMITPTVFQSIIKDETVEIEQKNRQESEKIVSLKTPSVIIPKQKEIDSLLQPGYQAKDDTTGKRPAWSEPARQTERETPGALKKRLEENAANAMQQQGKGSQHNRQQLLKEREQQRKEKIRQRERELKERQRKREAELKQRERERQLKLRK